MPPRCAAEAALAAGLLRTQPPPSGGVARVTSTIPVGAGLSSSAAFSVALLLALGHDPDPLALARDCQEAERGAGSHVGLLDPLAIAAAHAGHALLVDFTTLDTRHVPVPDDAAFVIVHSETPRLLTTTGRTQGRAGCERAAHLLGRRLGLWRNGDLDALADPVLRRRARHVITECGRVREAELLLSRGNLGGLGAVMTEGHRSLGADYRVSLPAVDELVEHLLAAARCPRCPHDGRRLRRLRAGAVQGDSPRSTRDPRPAPELAGQPGCRRSSSRDVAISASSTPSARPLSIDSVGQPQPALQVIDPSRHHAAWRPH